MRWLTQQQQVKLKSLEQEYDEYYPGRGKTRAVTFNGYVERYKKFKNLTDNLIEFYHNCCEQLKYYAPDMVAWRWSNILDTEKSYQQRALNHNWSENLFKPQMHNMEWWHGTGNPYCVCIN